MTGKSSAPHRLSPSPSIHSSFTSVPSPQPFFLVLSLWWLQPPHASLSKAACKTPFILSQIEATTGWPVPSTPGKALLHLPNLSCSRGASGLWQSSRCAICLCPGIPLAQAPCTAPSSLPTTSLPSFLKLCSWTCLPVPAWLFRTVNSRVSPVTPAGLQGTLVGYQNLW